MYVQMERERGGGGEGEKERDGERKRELYETRLTIVVFPIHGFHRQSKVSQLDTCSLLLGS